MAISMATIGTTVSTLKAVIDLTSKVYGHLTGDDGQRLVVHVFGSILFEMRVNVQRARHLVQRWDEAKEAKYITMSFTVTDAQLPEMCKLLPSSTILYLMNSVNSHLKVIDMYHRPAVMEIDPQYPDLGRKEWRLYGKALAFARDLKDRGYLERFNSLVQIANGLGKEAYGKEWDTGDTLQVATIPDEIDINAPVPGDDV